MGRSTARTVSAAPATWSKRDVLRAILQRRSDGRSLCATPVAEQQSDLYKAALREFGQWTNALNAAGIDPMHAGRYRRWSHETVIERIQQLAEEGRSLNYRAMRGFDGGFLAAATKRFSSWDEALRAAGVEPGRYRVLRPPWTRETLIRDIRQIHSDGGKVNHGAVGKSPLRHAATRLFGSWDDALRAVGLDPGRVRLCREHWTPEAVVEEIRARHQRGQAVNSKAVSASSLYRAGARLLGSWRRALKAAGLDPERIQKHRVASKPWKTDTVLQEIRRKHKVGEPLNGRDVHPQSLHGGGVRFFGSWDEALTAAGLDPSKIRKRPVAPKRPPRQSPEEKAIIRDRRIQREKADALKGILRREHTGLPLNHTAVLRDDRRLHADILRLFGTWDAAMRAAGIDPARVRRHRRRSRRAVINRICELDVAGQPLNVRAIQISEATLASAAERHFSSWCEALETAGIDSARWHKRVPDWTRQRVIHAIHKIHASDGQVNHGAVGRSSLSRAGVLLFGSWDAALLEAGLDPDEIRIRRKPWTPEEVVVEIQRKHEQGEPLNARDVSPHSLRSRGTVFFGSWDAALTAAGLDPAKIRQNTSRSRRRHP